MLSTRIPKHNLSSVRILIADGDFEMSVVLAHVLRRMGFTELERVGSGRDALNLMRQSPFDILITEWQLRPLDGIELISKLRQAEDARSRALPVIMLTARAELHDVIAARDAGANEFVIKPYTSTSIFDHISQVVDHPRGFLLGRDYVGPDRRRRPMEVGLSDRRKAPPRNGTRALLSATSLESPALVPPDFSLKKQIGISGPLESIITPALLAEAQAAIDTLKDESLRWIRDDLAEAERCYARLSGEAEYDDIEALKDVLLSIKSRAGTFGYRTASDVAQSLYRFLRNDYMIANPQHNMVLLKHLQGLKVLLACPDGKKPPEMERKLLEELKLVAEKFQRE